MQALLGTAMATAPVTANMPGGSLKALLFSGFFTVLWLVSAALFRAAAKGDQ
jgi:type IV secretory pathway TrbD component